MGGAGLALKSLPIHGAYGCYACHAAIDGHVKTKFDKDSLRLWFYDGMVSTQLILLAKGLIHFKGN